MISFFITFSYLSPFHRFPCLPITELHSEQSSINKFNLNGEFKPAYMHNTFNVNLTMKFNDERKVYIKYKNERV